MIAYRIHQRHVAWIDSNNVHSATRMYKEVLCVRAILLTLFVSRHAFLKRSTERVSTVGLRRARAFEVHGPMCVGDCSDREPAFRRCHEHDIPLVVTIPFQCFFALFGGVKKCDASDP